jgi:hypothetical protein
VRSQTEFGNKVNEWSAGTFPRSPRFGTAAFTTIMAVTTLHVLGALVLAVATFLAWLFFYVGREIGRDRKLARLGEPSLPI